MYNEVLKFKKKYPSTIAFRLKEHCKVLENKLVVLTGQTGAENQAY